MKSTFANTISDLGGIPLIANECERYGMTWGCDGDCPVFARGECHIPEEQVEMIMTTDRFDNFTIEEINELYPQLELKIS